VVSNDLIDHKTVFPLELNTMPGWAGSSWYFFRYMEDTKRDEVFASKEALNYWKNVDLYIGGSEHATGHLLYSRFWVKFMHDRGLVPVDEPFKKLINQGMILGESAFVYRMNSKITISEIPDVKKFAQMGDEWAKEIKKLFIKTVQLKNENILLSNIYVDYNEYKRIKKENSISNITMKDWEKQRIESFYNLITEEEKKFFDVDNYSVSFSADAIHTDVSFVNNSNELDINAFKKWREEYKNAEFIKENDGTFKVSREVEKMSKSKYNVVNPDDICNQYGADTLRMYEMFLGPLEQAKPWNTAGITGVHGFLKKLWKLYHSAENESFYVSDDLASKDSLKTLHKTIKKVQEDIENFSFNTSVSSFMIAVNELSAQKCNSREVLEALAILISPYAPHIAEELWEKLGHSESISTAPFPKFEEKYLVESTKEYPISFNGKMRFTLELPLDLSKDEIESAVMAHEKTAQYLEGRTPKKVIIVPGKIVNIVG
jgi:leucyl-tRNA synthetase